jgi:oxygen-independent coproporphyrinogen III oxidase
MKVRHIYIHFPFCVSKCPYCDFFSVADDGNTIHRKYVDYLLREIEIYDDIIDNEIETLYIGGGTPSLLDPGALEKILKKFSFSPGAEITIEANPATVSFEKLKSFRDLGANRLSLGAQSFIDRELKVLGRQHNSKEIYEAYGSARKAGFGNISLDLITGIPGQTPASVIFNAGEIASLAPEHASVYILTYYGETRFADMLNSGKLKKIPDDIEMEFFDLSEEILSRSGLKKYEISNFSRTDKFSRHNINTWNFGDYLGFGASAHSFCGKKRFSNPDSIEKYYETVRDDLTLFNETPPAEETALKNEFIMLGLRKTEGFSIDSYKNYFGSSLLSDYGSALSRFAKDGILEEKENIIRFRPDKLCVFNSVVSEIIS